MQNTSPAVMQNRLSSPDDKLDHFPTPPWATRALCEWLRSVASDNKFYSVWEPACAEGHMSRALMEYFNIVRSSDIVYRGFGVVHDFLTGADAKHDWIITNPPFSSAALFATTALPLTTEGVALLVRIAFLEGVGRYHSLFSISPPTDILQFTERVPMFKGKLDRNGSTATAYCWLVWQKNWMPWVKGTGSRAPAVRFHWIAPCRKRLERAEDYA